MKRLELEYTRMEDRVQKELRGKDALVRKGLTIVGTLRAKVDAPGSATSTGMQRWACEYAFTRVFGRDQFEHALHRICVSACSRYVLMERP